MLFTVVSKILGFSREVVLSYFYGISNISDAYLISWTIPGVIFAFVGIGISTSFIPLYSKIKNDEGFNSSINYMNNVISFLTLINIIIVFIVLLFTPAIVKIFALGFKGDTLNLAVLFTRISVFGIFFSGFVYIFTAFLQINNNFVIPALIGIPFNLIIIISIFLSSKINIILLAIGILLAKIAELLFLIPYAKKNKYSYKLNFNLKDQYIKKMIYLSLPVIIGASVNQINALVDRTLASIIAVGGISALNYANKLNGFVQGLFVTTIATAMYPRISKMAAEHNIDGMKNLVSEAINSISLLVIPATIGAMLFAEPVVILLFGRGAFDPQAISMTSTALFYYSIGMIGFGLREILSRAFYSFQDTKTPMINAAIAMAINIVLNIILSKDMGIGGLALATSISAIFCTVLLFISFRKKIGSFGLKNIIISFIKILCSSLVMGIIAKLSYDILLKHISENLSLIAAIIIGAVVYFVIIYFMGIEEVDSMIEAVKNKLKRVKA